MLLYRNIQRFEDSSNKYPSSNGELSIARQQAIDAVKWSCNDRLTKLCVVILSDDDDTPVRKRPRQVSPIRLSDDDDDDIGHVKVCAHLAVHNIYASLRP